ncbi:MBL fold metallo-hydrolase [Nonomuraea sediminis]|uniref:MBL fold metallo-hydrolase n=1 Tax=Nonomuraea sediminis TaxID=2835864 RepID=UPI001BDBE995|nr:MBL fold metallo-hydrolase [Nonomuraea sediminis]
MDLDEVMPGLHLLRFGLGQAYLWHERDALTLIDTGMPGAAADVAGAITSLGFSPSDVRNVVVTHAHEDHYGSVAEIASWGEAAIMVGRADAAVIRGHESAPRPVREEMPDWELALYDNLPPMPVCAPARVDRELDDGDVLDFGGGAEVIAIPGHTAGSVAIHLPRHRLLFSGDTIANIEGNTILGVFNTDPAGAADSFRKLAEFDLGLVLVGHGDPLTGEASARLRQVASAL